MKSLAVGLALASTLAATAQARHVTLASLRDQKRVLLVFANGDIRLAAAQLDVAAKNVSGFNERQLILVGLQGSQPAVPTELLAPADDVAARKQFRVKPGQFTVVLLGKDGGEKLRSSKPIPWETLEKTIDSMPMRQSEMRDARH